MAVLRDMFLYDELQEFIENYGYKNYNKQNLKQFGEKEFLKINSQELRRNNLKINTVINALVEFIFNNICYDSNERADLEIWVNNCNIMEVYYPLIEKIKIIVNERIIKKEDLFELGKRLATESYNGNKIKLGLILLKLSHNEKSKDIFKVFSIHNEYIFYALEGMKEYCGANSYIFEAAKISKGYGKLIALSILEPLSEEIKLWFIEKGIESDFIKDKTIEIVINKVDIEWYVNNIKSSYRKFNVISKIIVNLYKYRHSIDGYYNYDLFYDFTTKFCKYAKSFNHLYALRAVKFFIRNYNKESMIEGKATYKDVIKETSILDEEIKLILDKDIWISILKEEVDKIKQNEEEILEVATVFNYNLNFEDLYPILENGIFNVSVCKYIMEELDVENKIKFISFFEDNYYENYLSNKKDKVYSCLYYVLKNMKELSVNYLDYNIKILICDDFRCRKQALKNLKENRDKLSVDQIVSIKSASKIGGDTEFNKLILEVIDEDIDIKDIIKEDIKDICVDPDLMDIYMLTTYVEDMEWRNLSKISEYINEGVMVYLKPDINNVNDYDAIKVITEEGWDIGYIPTQDNYMLRRLLEGNKKLYGLIEEVDEDYSQCKISIYLSRCDIEEQVNDILKLILVESDGLLN